MTCFCFYQIHPTSYFYICQMNVKEIISVLENIAPLASQESYDNSGLIVGQAEMEVSNTLISLDCTEDIIQEAIENNCNLVISHHPILFKGLKKLTGSNYVERTLLLAIKHDVAIFAAHTNLDHYLYGVNYKIAQILGIDQPQILAPSAQSQIKLIVYVPNDALEKVRNAIFDAGGGTIGNYDKVSFTSDGACTYQGNENSNSTYAAKGEFHSEAETKLEVLISKYKSQKIVNAMIAAHPYEEVAYDLIPIENLNSYEGAGMIGELTESIDETSFLKILKDKFKCGCIKHTALRNKPIKKIAWCGGSGSFLLNAAKAKNADIFITGDFKYHEFFDAEDQLIIADIGHYESEQFTIELIADLIRKKIPTFAPYLTEKNTNPVNYF